MQMIEFLYYHAIPFTVIATKADKLSKVQQKKNLINIASIYKCGADDIIATSAENRQGLDKVLEEIEKVLNLPSEEDSAE